MSNVRGPSALLIAATLAGSVIGCGDDAKMPTAPAPSIATVTVSATTTTFVPGQSTQLFASAKTAGGHAVSGAAFTWLSQAPAVAEVDATGRVTAVSPGTAMIAAMAGTVRDTVKITVQAAPVGSVVSLSSIVDSVRLAFNMPAMGAAIVTLEDGLIAIGAGGTRRATGGAAVTTDDLWHLGSITKPITSLLAAVAVSQNRIQWTTTIPQIFPELANIRAEHRDVTLRDLLSHQSGLTGSFGGQWSPGSGTTAVEQRASWMAYAVQQPPAHARGTYMYSTLGYAVAGAMLEQVFGTSFEAAMAAQVFAPLGMTDAGFGLKAAAGSTTQPVAHYWENGSWRALENHDIPPVRGPGGGAHMSLASWGHVMREVLRVEAGTSTLAPAPIARQTTSEVIAVNAGTSYGLGWFISARPWTNGKVLFHYGSTGGNESLAILAPLRNVAFLVTTNGYDPGGRSQQAVNGLQNRLITYYNTGK